MKLCGLFDSDDKVNGYQRDMTEIMLVSSPILESYAHAVIVSGDYREF